VFGPSRVFDTSRYAWRDAAWTGRDVLGALFYELHLGTFTAEGTFEAATRHLDHLLDLGVEVVELMPVATFDGRWGWGYDGVFPYAVCEPYGGPRGLQRFVDTCHRRGLAVCLDVVYNHIGPNGTYLSSFGPYFTDRHMTTWGPAVNLGSAEVRRWLCDNALRWFEDFHIDCLRLDAVHALVDDSHRHVLAQLSDEVAELSRRLGRRLSLVAESDLNDPRMVEPTATGGLGMTAQWSDDFHHALHALLLGEQQGYYVDFGSMDVLARTLTSVFRHAGDYSRFRGRPWGRPVDRAAHRGHRFLGYLQNHDQIGNRALGDRVSASLTPGRCAIGAALVLTAPFTPMLFMGEEWAATTPWQFFSDLSGTRGTQVAAGRRAEFARHGWESGDIPDPQAASTFAASKLDWRQLGREPHAGLLSWYRRLVALRRREPDLRADALGAVKTSYGRDWLVVHRGAFDIVVNVGAGTFEWATDAAAETVLSWGDVVRTTGGVVVPPDSVVILRSG
jgi:maltooligosyltrehalose trehalohydrolase